MKEQVISFQSAGLRLHGVLGLPEGYQPSQRRAAFLVLHGFGSNSESSSVLAPTRVLSDFGYVTLRFDMRGCGNSAGEFGRVICLEQVEDLGNALAFLARHPAVDPDRIGAIGSSFGGAVAVYAGGVNPRLAAVISNGGWGHGERKFRGQHPTPEAWAKFTAMLEEGRDHRDRTGQSLMVPRHDIVPIPEHVRASLERQNVGMLAPHSVEMFPAETAQSMFDFRAEEVVGNIAPRPLLLIHAANDSVTPTEQSIELFKHSGQPSELHLFSGLDHFLFAENSKRVWGVLRDWLDRYFPAKQ
ncbi:MAG: alpha/beta fold hydrolase [Xanthobacteraceae bacterium]|jgi:pimeloyl-ACP methyl ester carboxylesterase